MEADDAAIGQVSNLTARLCAEVKARQIVLGRRTLDRIASTAQVEALGDPSPKGFARAATAGNSVALAEK